MGVGRARPRLCLHRAPSTAAAFVTNIQIVLPFERGIINLSRELHYAFLFELVCLPAAHQRATTSTNISHDKVKAFVSAPSLLLRLDKLPIRMLVSVANTVPILGVHARAAVVAAVSAHARH